MGLLNKLPRTKIVEFTPFTKMKRSFRNISCRKRDSYLITCTLGHREEPVRKNRVYLSNFRFHHPLALLRSFDTWVKTALRSEDSPCLWREISTSPISRVMIRPESGYNPFKSDPTSLPKKIIFVSNFQ